MAADLSDKSREALHRLIDDLYDHCRVTYRIDQGKAPGEITLAELKNQPSSEMVRITAEAEAK